MAGGLWGMQLHETCCLDLAVTVEAVLKHRTVAEAFAGQYGLYALII